MAGERSNFEKYDLKKQNRVGVESFGVKSQPLAIFLPLIASRIQKNRSLIFFKCL